MFKTRVLLAFLLFATMIVKAQDTISKFNFRIKANLENEKTTALKCLISKDGEQLKTFMMEKNMTYIPLDFNSNYLFELTKEGYISQTIEVNTKINVVDSALINYRYKFVVPPFTAKVNLKKQGEDSLVVYASATGKVRYSIDKAAFEFVELNPTIKKIAINKSIDSLSIQKNIPEFVLQMNIRTIANDAFGTKISIRKNNEPFRDYIYDSINYKIVLPKNETYIITCTKENYIPKSFVVNTHSPHWENYDSNKQFKTVVKLEQQPKNKTMSYSNTVGCIYFNYRSNGFEFIKNDFYISEINLTENSK